ncbi:hypothetical protein BTHERMOSOX_678 [Bathymodiolus thermophilus thioautotrophic gill symbiont]|nr:hypothetical protein THERMOT_132 [Bathymodiolus thermophilus thioautotrophic gill symbiont]SGZ99787.1 hypothetical protein BTHERMOSOX_678 [Bathymodiolus thermophilus thioautotrophic gill symbiont]
MDFDDYLYSRKKPLFNKKDDKHYFLLNNVRLYCYTFFKSL